MIHSSGERAGLADAVRSAAVPARVVDEAGRAAFGCYDGPVALRAEAFRLRDLFGREVGAFRRRLALGGFAFLGLATDEMMAGLAAVRLGYLAQVFGWLHDFRTGRSYERRLRLRPGRLDFPLEPDAHTIRFEGRRDRLVLRKCHAEGRLEVEARLGALSVEARVPFGFAARPLRVVNPSCGDPYRFTFTEKAAPLFPEAVSVRLDGGERAPDPSRVALLSDWTAGYFARRTNWLWGAFAGRLADGRPVGANLAALVNESFYPENAVWIGDRRLRLPRALFDWDPADPARPWRVFTEDGAVDLRFEPSGGRAERTRLPFLKVSHRQLFGSWSGTLRDADGTAVPLAPLRGLAELHLSLW